MSTQLMRIIFTLQSINYYNDVDYGKFPTFSYMRQCFPDSVNIFEYLFSVLKKFDF